MTTLREAAQQALEALENCTSEHGHRCTRCDSEVDEGGRVVTALRAALAQQEQKRFGYIWPTGRHPEFRYTQLYTAPPRRETEQEPVAMVENGTLVRSNLPSGYTGPLYTHPPRREWRSLSEGEVASCWAKGFEACKDQTVGDLRMHIARAVEAALKEKNHE